MKSTMEPTSSTARTNVRAVNACAQCGERISLPAWSEQVDSRRVRHLWECVACGYAFETLVCFPADIAA